MTRVFTQISVFISILSSGSERISLPRTSSEIHVASSTAGLRNAFQIAKPFIWHLVCSSSETFVPMLQLFFLAKKMIPSQRDYTTAILEIPHIRARLESILISIASVIFVTCPNDLGADDSRSKEARNTRSGEARALHQVQKID